MIAETFGGVCRIVAGVQAEWHCDPVNGAPRVYFANHASHLDFIVIWSALPRRCRRDVRPVAGSDYWTRGPLRRFMADHLFHAVLVERGGARALPAARVAIALMAAELDQRHSLIVFPEGTRSRDGAIGEFKSGLYHLSRLRPGVDLVPVFLENTGRILPKGESFPVPMLSRVVFGGPLRAIEHEDKRHFLCRARASLVDLGGSHDVCPN
jgi:1-acyl-sn-glycerol-3-phosphate acyltransferase